MTSKGLESINDADVHIVGEDRRIATRLASSVRNTWSGQGEQCDGAHHSVEIADAIECLAASAPLCLNSEVDERVPAIQSHLDPSLVSVHNP